MLENLQIVKKLSSHKAECLCIRCGNTYVCNYYDASKSKIGNQCISCKKKWKYIEVPTQNDLNEAYRYNEITGDLTHAWNTVHSLAGELATYSHSQGYLSMYIGTKEYLAHRVIWTMKKGYWPIQIDHKDHVRSNNSWLNLREVISRENQLNTGISCNNTSSVNGVRILPSGKFCALIMVNRKQISLGTFDTLEEAANVRKQANIEYGFHDNHGT